MSKKLFMLVAWYVAGSVVTWLFAEKKWQEIKQEMQKAEKTGNDWVKVLFGYLLNIQKKFFWEVTENVVTPERKEMIQEKQKEIMDLISEYRIDAEKMMQWFQQQWAWYVQKAYEELEKFSKLKTEEGEQKLTKFGKHVVDEFKKQSQKMFSTLQKSQEKTQSKSVKTKPKKSVVKKKSPK